MPDGRLIAPKEAVFLLFTFDCDKTLDIGGGPIPVSRLLELNIVPCSRVVLVSPSPSCIELPYPRVTRAGDRKANLIMASEIYPSVIKIYISDNPGDSELAKKTGYIYIHPNNFV